MLGVNGETRCFVEVSSTTAVFWCNVDCTVSTEVSNSVMLWSVVTYVVYLASLPHCASTQSQLVRASGICCCRPNCLELTERWSAWSDA